MMKIINAFPGVDELMTEEETKNSIYPLSEDVLITYTFYLLCNGLYYEIFYYSLWSVKFPSVLLNCKVSSDNG